MNFNKYKNIKKTLDISELSSKPFKGLKKLFLKKNKSLGRSQGTIVAWHRGGGVKRSFRILFSNKFLINSYGIIRSIEYDPNRSIFVGLIQQHTGSFFYVPISSLLKVNDIIYFSKDYNFLPKNGDFLRLRCVPLGIPLYNLEKFPGSGSVYSKSAGTFSILLNKSLNYGTVKLPSGKECVFDLDCNVTLGVASNSYNKFYKRYKAGTNRLLNRRPIVRGVAMNPIDHPHGGGAGKSTPGRPSVSPWGKLTKGVFTRKKNLNK